MTQTIIKRLFDSFNELERAIVSARITLERKGTPPQTVLDRIDSYEHILTKQRELARDLFQHMSSGNWKEVSRHVQLINALSAMIRDDAREVLSALAPEGEEVEFVEEKPTLLC